MKKRSKIVVGASIACFCIVAIAIQAVFGGGMGLGIAPKEIEVAQGSTIPYVITVYNYQDIPDLFDVSVLPGSCDRSWFSWTTTQTDIVPADRGQKGVLLDVTPTKKGNYTFTVRAVSKSDPGICASQEAHITVTDDGPKPDLIITKIWNVSEVIHYEIKNIGNATAQACSHTCISVSEDHVNTSLDPGDSVKRQFKNYTCKQNDKIKVCADNNGVIDERDENNNCMEWTCPPCPNGGQPCIVLTPDKSEPQYPGTVINWTACACDPEVEGCKLCYRFWLEGPGTGRNKIIMQNWSTNNTCSLSTIWEDIGDSNIYVDAADCDHLIVLRTAVYRNYTIIDPRNYPPVCACLMPDKPAPQQYVEGLNITWNASAIDPEGDPLEYRFLLSGPGTGHNFTVMQDWRTAYYPNCPTWMWNLSCDDMGNNHIKVEIRDGKYVPYPDYFDVNATYPKYWIGPEEC
jgi:hypothetical protein